MLSEDQVLLIVAFISGALATYLVVYRDDIVALGNLLFILIVIAIVVGIAGMIAALGFIGVAFVFVCYVVYLIGLKIKAAYQRRKRG